MANLKQKLRPPLNIKYTSMPLVAFITLGVFRKTIKINSVLALLPIHRPNIMPNMGIH